MPCSLSLVPVHLGIPDLFTHSAAGSIPLHSIVRPAALRELGAAPVAAADCRLDRHAAGEQNPRTPPRLGFESHRLMETVIALTQRSSPASLQVDLRIVGETDASYGVEESVMPLPYGVDLVDDLARH